MYLINQRNMQPRSTLALQCTDVPGWEDSAEFPCPDYEERKPLGLENLPNKLELKL